MRPDTITKEIREEFTDHDKLEMAASLTTKLMEIEAVENEKKQADGVFNERRKVLEGETESLYRRYNKGYEMAQIGCDIRYNDPTPSQKSYYRMDTSQCVETVDMSWEEKQEELQFNLPQPKPDDLCTCGHDRAAHDFAEDGEPHGCFADTLEGEGDCACEDFNLKPRITEVPLPEPPTDTATEGPEAAA